MSRLSHIPSNHEVPRHRALGLFRQLKWVAIPGAADSRSSAKAAELNNASAQDVPDAKTVCGELIGQGFDPALAEQLVLSSEPEKSPATGLRKRVRSTVAGMLRIARPREFFGQTRSVSVFAGSAGAGKSTTVAKIAGYAKAQYGKRVAMISMEPFGTPGFSPVMHFGDLLDLPAFTCRDAASLNRLLGGLDEDLILIDTPGASANDHGRLSAIKALIATAHARVHVVVSAATRSCDVSGILKQFADVRGVHMLITKIDETESKAAFVSDLLKNETPLSFITDGQSVPERLWTPSAEDLANYVLAPNAAEAGEAEL